MLYNNNADKHNIINTKARSENTDFLPNNILGSDLFRGKRPINSTTREWRCCCISENFHDPKSVND